MCLHDKIKKILNHVSQHNYYILETDDFRKYHSSY